MQNSPCIRNGDYSEVSYCVQSIKFYNVIGISNNIKTDIVTAKTPEKPRHHYKRQKNIIE